MAPSNAGKRRGRRLVGGAFSSAPCQQNAPSEPMMQIVLHLCITLAR